MMSNVTIGAPVRTADGKELGKVKEVVGGCFKVDAPMQPDYWLATDTISDNSASNSVVTLILGNDELNDAKQDGPEHTGYHRHM